jgi:cobalamin biosynthesis Co2+ chelatase CbiK/glucan-binding YG repeat protein
MKKGIKKTLVMLLSVAMVFTMMAMPVYADDFTETETSEVVLETPETDAEPVIEEEEQIIEPEAEAQEEVLIEEPAAEVVQEETPVVLAAAETAEEEATEPAAETVELADGTYNATGLSTAVLNMYHFHDAQVVIKGEDAWLITTEDTDKTVKRFDGMAYGKQSEILDETDTTHKTLVEGTAIAKVVPTYDDEGTLVTRTFVLPVPKSVFEAGADIYYMIKYTEGYNEDHDGDWYKADGGDYYLTGYTLEYVSDSTVLPGEEPEPEPEPAYTPGWHKIDGDWYYYNEDGTKAVNTWKKDSKGWCYLGEDGKMVTNDWAKDTLGYVRVGSDGYMITGTKWIKADGIWYHITNGYRDQNKWMKDSKGWCYLGEEGAMVTNGWAKDSKGYCWIGSDGYMVEKTQWLKLDGTWYHITNGYRDQSKWMKDSKGWCYLDAEGAMVSNGWAKDSKGYCWIGPDGYMVEKTQWLKLDGTWYHITNGYRDQSTWMKDSKGWCYLDKDGKMVTEDWAKDSKGYCWIGSEGYMIEEDMWIGEEGKIGSSYIVKGYRVDGKTIEIEGTEYTFDKNGKLTGSAIVLKDGVYTLPELSAGPSEMFNHFVSDSKLLIVEGDKATIRFITDGSTSSIQKYSKIALGKSSELVQDNYQATLPEGTTIIEGVVQPFTAGTVYKYLFEITLDKAEAEALLNNEINEDIYITVWNKEGSKADKIPGWYKASNDIYLSLGSLGEKTEAPAEAGEVFGFTLQVGQYTEGEDFHTASFEGVTYALKDAAGNVYDPTYTTSGMLTYSNLSADNTYTFTATKEGWTVVKQGEWNVDAHAYEYIPMGTDEMSVTITKDDADKNISDHTNPGMVFRMKQHEKNVVDEALEAVPENLNYELFTEASGNALKAAVEAADPNATDEEQLKAMADAIMTALEGLTPLDGRYEVTLTKYNGTPYYLYEGLADNDKTTGKAVLVVENGVMTAELVLKNQSYGHVYLGTKDEAIAAATAAEAMPESAIAIDMPAEQITINGKEYKYSKVTVPVPALQKDIAYAYHSSNTKYTYSEGWYDHGVMYQADSLVAIGGDEPVEPEKTELTVTNNTGMFKADSAYLVTEEGQEYLVMVLSGSGYHELFKGTYEQAVANGDGSKEKGNDKWVHGYQNADGKWEFKIPVNDDETYVPCIAISNSYYTKYLNGQNTLERAFFSRQFEIDRLAETLVTGDYEESKELTVNNNVSMFKPGEKAVLKIVGGPNNNEYGNFITLNMGSNSYTKVRAKKYTNRGAEFVEDGTVEIALGEGNVFADIPVLVKGETNVIEFWSEKNQVYYQRDLTIDLEAGTATFDPHKATVDDLEGLTDEEALDFVTKNANVDLMNSLIEAIQVQKRFDDTDLYCELAKKCWDALSEEDKAQDDGYFSDDTGDASKDDPLNTAPDKEKELLVVSFGTSFNDSRVNTIGAVEKALAAAYGDTYAVRRAFTAQIIINHVQSRDGEKIDNVTQAMDKAVAAGVKEMVVQPTHLMSGAEFDELKAEIDKYAEKINIVYAKPLLDSDADKEAVAKAAVDAAVKDAGFASLEAADADKTAFVFMGHGTSHDANVTYTQMQQTMDTLGYANCFVGTVEGKPASTALPEVKKALEAKGYTKVVLRPLMVVAGDHANNDMAADEEGSWYYAFVNGGEFEVEGQDTPVDIGAGFGKDNVTCQVNGLGEIESIQQLYVAHTAAAMAE